MLKHCFIFPKIKVKKKSQDFTLTCYFCILRISAKHIYVTVILNLSSILLSYMYYILLLFKYFKRTIDIFLGDKLVL